MTTYNGEKYLREQIDSILSQTIQDFELVVCDDCSSDSTLNILRDYSKTDARIKIFQNKENLGFKKNFERAMSLCKGDYIALSDQDDIWMPNHLEVLLNAIGDKMMACGNCLLIDGDGVNRGITYWQEELFNGIPRGNLEMAYSIAFFRNPFQGASMMINVKYINYILPIPQNLSYHDSWVSILACFCGGLSYVDVVITKYRMHGGNVTKVRLKPKSRWKEFLRSAKNPCFYDREAMLDGIENRLSLSSKDEKELNKIKSLVKRGKTFWGRIGIIPFKLKYYKTIYY